MTNRNDNPIEETAVSTTTCTRCKCESTLTTLFRKTWSGRYCPACAVKVEVRNAKIIFSIFGVFILLDLFRDGVRYGFTSWEAWSTLLIILVSTISLVGHEFSHALAAWLLGGQVFGIHLGIGHQIVRRWVNDFYLGISLFPVSGLCYAGFPTINFVRLRYLVFVSAGLIFHFFVVFISFILIGLTNNASPLLVPIFLLNGLMLLFNLLPRKFTTAAGQTGSDGRRIWELITGKLTANELRQTYFRLATSFAYQRGQTDQAAHFAREGLSLLPQDEYLENMRLFLLLKMEDKLEEAHAAWKEIVESGAINAISPLQQAVYFNNYAWASIMVDPSPDNLKTAHFFADKAYRMVPWVPFIKGTLAAVYVAQGEYEKGVQWALSVAKEGETDQSPNRDENVAASLATAALGTYRMGEQETAVRYLQQALALAADELSVKKAAAEIL